MKRLFIVFFLGIAGSINIRAQSIGPSTINSSGGSGILGSNEFEWSIGEMTLVSTFTGSSVIVTQGVLQPVLATEAVPNSNVLKNNLKVFPNPASSFVNIEYTGQKNEVLSYTLYDLAGRYIKAGRTDVTSSVSKIQVDLSDLANAGYMLEVTANGASSGTEKASFNIQKIK